jgi:hypothetical protein
VSQGGNAAALQRILGTVFEIYTYLLGMQVQQLMPGNIMQLHLSHQAVLGPMVTLAAVECRDVAAVLSALLNQSDLRQLVCLSQSVRQQVDAALSG